MVKQTLIHDGHIWYASKPMSEGRATALAKRYTAEGYKWMLLLRPPSAIVLHRPLDPEGVVALRDIEQGKQYAAACRGIGSMEWAKRGGETWVLGSGGWYRVSEEACSCPHYTLRCAKVYIKCKHICALEMRARLAR